MLTTKKICIVLRCKAPGINANIFSGFQFVANVTKYLECESINLSILAILIGCISRSFCLIEKLSFVTQNE